jgi:hypothetical protein
MNNIPQDVAALLGPGEQIQLYIKQKIYHPKISIDSVALTNERIILRHPRDLALKKDFTDFSYTDIANAVLDRGILRSTIKCHLRFGGDPLILGKLSNPDAEKAYGVIRSNIARYQTPFSGPTTTYITPSKQVLDNFPTQSSATAPTTQAPSNLLGRLTCPKCGGLSAYGSRFCANCGTSLTESLPPATQ